MNVVIKRIFKGDDYTIGKLYIDNKYFCDTIEDIDRKLHKDMNLNLIKKTKVYGKTAIPVGTYKLNMTTTSPKFGRTAWAKKYGGKVPRILDVPGFSGILIHPGNTAEDSHGCILVGKNDVKGKVTNSTNTWYALMEVLKEYKEIEIKIE